MFYRFYDNFDEEKNTLTSDQISLISKVNSCKTEKLRKFDNKYVYVHIYTIQHVMK